LRTVVVHAYLAVWAITLAVAALTALVAGESVRSTLGLALGATVDPPASPARVCLLAIHNLPICAWPLLLGSLRLRPGSRWRRLADIVVAACALANVLPVAAALGGYGWALVPYVPQLPLEWAALAVGFGSWVAERRQGLAGRERLALLAAIAALALAAALLETYAVPHR
jgi:hypothetical protein